jgi:hypothetical protein
MDWRRDSTIAPPIGFKKAPAFGQAGAGRPQWCARSAGASARGASCWWSRTGIHRRGTVSAAAGYADHLPTSFVYSSCAARHRISFARSSMVSSWRTLRPVVSCMKRAEADTDPDRLSFVHAVRVIRRKLRQAPAIPPSPEARLAPSRARRNSAGALASPRTPPQQTGRQTKDEQLSAPTQI